MKVFILVLLSLMFFNLQAVDFELKNIKLMEVKFAESNDSRTPWREREVSFAYKNEPVSEIVKKIMLISGKQVIGLEQLVDNKPSMVFMTKVKTIKAVTTLLKCAGFKMVETQNNFLIVEDKNINPNACLY